MAMIKHELAKLVEIAAREAQSKDLIPPTALPEVSVERPQNPEHGDYASTMALKLARAARMNPMVIASAIVSSFPPIPGVEDITVVAPGFINFRLTDNWLREQVPVILGAGASYGSLDIGKGQRVQIEFVSANPTGPLHVGNGRGAMLGNALANILAAAGYSVEKEYYVNDAGSQIEVFSNSLHARYLQALGKDVAFPESGYGGQYMIEVGQELATEYGEKYLDQPSQLGAIGLERMLDMIRVDLANLGVVFDSWFRESSIYKEGKYQAIMDLLKEKGYVAEREGALWFTSTSLGDDKDNVLVRTTGVPTYFAADAAYHYDKLAERGFDRAINIWGADHLGHVSRLKAALTGMGIDHQRLNVIIMQLVTLKRGAEAVRLSKRTGDIITLREVLEEVGADACRFFFLSRSADSQMDFDLELAKQQSNENPVYYVQYAHARIASILDLAKDRDIDFSDGDVSLLATEAELELIRQMILLPEVIEMSAHNLEPHHLPHYAQELAAAFHSFYTVCRVVSEDIPMTKARLKLVQATKIGLARTLALMGMTVPESM
ncbi:MAG: arginine--tRNA ligase [Dehalococcoidia bacterium]|nr:arginine--tRNA ligase [Dehalococcoidia bacterium]